MISAGYELHDDGPQSTAGGRLVDKKDQAPTRADALDLRKASAKGVGQGEGFISEIAEPNLVL